jgi:hypothetical protein
VWMVKSRREAAHRVSRRAGLGLWCSSGGFGWGGDGRRAGAMAPRRRRGTVYP